MALFPSLTTMETPTIAAIIVNQPSHPCDSRSIKLDRIAANIGIVAKAVNTNITEVSIIPRVKKMEFIEKANMTINPCQV